MADTEVDYESDNALMQEEEVSVRDTKRTTRGRGFNQNEKAENSKYEGRSGEFETLNSKKNSDNGAGAIKSIEGWIIFVTGVHEEAQEDDILDQFSECGEVKNIHLNLDRRTGFVKGYALIEYENFKDAKNAIEKMDGQKILGENISVDWAFHEDEKDTAGSRRRPDRRRR